MCIRDSCVGNQSDTAFVFSIPETITSAATQTLDGLGNVSSSTASFNDVIVYQGTYLSKTFTVDGSLDQWFILDNAFIDSSTIRVYVKGVADTGLGREYRKVDNILNISGTSETYLIQEVTDERYELFFGDGVFGKKLENEAVITVRYIITDGIEGNGPSSFTWSGSVT